MAHLTVFASGNDIWNNADEFHYVYRPMTGDGTIIAEVVSQQYSDPWSKAGVMMRQSLDPGSPDVGAYVTPGNGVSLQWRPSQDAGATWYGNTVAGGAPYWVKLVRSGSTFTAVDLARRSELDRPGIDHSTDDEPDLCRVGLERSQ